MRLILLFIGFCFMTIAKAQYANPFIKAMAELSLDHPDNALLYLDTAINAHPENEESVLKRAEVLFAKGQISKAAQDFLLAEKMQQGCGLYGLARCYAAQNKSTVSLEYLKKHLESKYKLSQADIKLDPAFSKLENSKEWKALWQQEWYNKYDDAAAEAAFMIKNKEYTEAINVVSTILKQHEKKHELLAIRAHAYYQMASYKNALSDYNSAIEIRRKQEYVKARGDVNIQLADYESAVKDYSLAIRLDSSDLPMYLKRAEALRQQGKYTEALQDIALYTTYFEFSEQAIFIAAQILFDKGEYLWALSKINKILEKNKSNPEFFIFRANTYLKTNMLKQAIRDYGMALDIDHTSTEVWVKRGQARLAAGDKNGACHDFSTAMRMNNKEAQQLLQQHCVN